MTIIDISYVSANTIDMQLANLCQCEPLRVDKLITRIESYVLRHIDQEFVTLDSFPPHDLRQTTLFLVESYYISYGTQGRELWVRTKSSLKIDDFTETVSYDQVSNDILDFYGIPITQDHMNVLDSYKTPSLSYWYFDILW